VKPFVTITALVDDNAHCIYEIQEVGRCKGEIVGDEEMAQPQTSEVSTKWRSSGRGGTGVNETSPRLEDWREQRKGHVHRQQSGI
jgi:hypothetical protein